MMKTNGAGYANHIAQEQSPHSDLPPEGAVTSSPFIKEDMRAKQERSQSSKISPASVRSLSNRPAQTNTLSPSQHQMRKTRALKTQPGLQPPPLNPSALSNAAIAAIPDVALPETIDFDKVNEGRKLMPLKNIIQAEKAEYKTQINRIFSFANITQLYGNKKEEITVNINTGKISDIIIFLRNSPKEGFVLIGKDSGNGDIRLKWKKSIPIDKSAENNKYHTPMEIATKIIKQLWENEYNATPKFSSSLQETTLTAIKNMIGEMGAIVNLEEDTMNKIKPLLAILHDKNNSILIGIKLHDGRIHLKISENNETWKNITDYEMAEWNADEGTWNIANAFKAVEEIMRNTTPSTINSSKKS